MKYLGFLVFIICLNHSFAQESSFGHVNLHFAYDHFSEGNLHSIPNPDYLDFSEGVKLISVSTSDVYFHKTYLVNQKGETISSGYMHSSYFLPNDNLIVISGHTNRIKDSFNPYGANDMTSMIVLATFNNFISRLKLNRR